MDSAPLVMPNLAGIRRTVRHRVDSAVLTLMRLGVDPSRIVLETAGPGESYGAVISQEPAPGTAINAATRVVLRIGGSGGMDLLPFALRDDSETELRGDRFFALFDNPALKLAFHLRHGGGYLALHPDEPLTARRWLEDLFRIDAEPWPAQRWHALARLIPQLHAIGGTASAVRIAIQAIFGLPVAQVTVSDELVPLPDSASIRLGRRNGRLAYDAVVGGGIVAEARVSVTLGPMPLDMWRLAQPEAERRMRQLLYRLVLPAHLAHHVRETWRVGDPADGTVLDRIDPPALLGVNAYLAASPHRKAA